MVGGGGGGGRVLGEWGFKSSPKNIKENGYIFKEDNSVKIVLSPSEKGVYSKRKESF